MRAMDRNLLVDAAIAVLSAATVLITVAVEPLVFSTAGPRPAAIAVLLTATVAALSGYLLRFRIGIGWSFAAVAGIYLLYLAFAGEAPAGVVPVLFAITVSLCRRVTPRASALTVAVFVLVNIVLQLARGVWPADAERLGLATSAAVVLPLLVFNLVANSAVPAAAGWWLRTNDARVQAQAELVEMTRQSRDLAVAEAVLTERGRMARELHDVAAHHLTAVAVSARALERVDDATIAARLRAQLLCDADQAMESINDVITVLREPAPPGGDGERAPVASVQHLTQLFDQVRQRGAVTVGDVHLDAVDESLPRSTSHAVFRIVQEALTNAERHAPGSTVTAAVTADAAAGHLEILVRSTAGTAQTAGIDGTGTGLRGMRERAELLGGTLSAQPSGNGFTVRARLPLTRKEQA